MEKNPAELFVNVKAHGMMEPDESRAVNTPITVPADTLLFTVKLLILMVTKLSDRQWNRLTCVRRHSVEAEVMPSIVEIVYYFDYNNISRAAFPLAGGLDDLRTRADASMTLCGAPASPDRAAATQALQRLGPAGVAIKPIVKSWKTLSGEF